jgi:uncharacterized protein
MGTDVTPLIPAGRQVIEAYGDGGFRVSGVRFEGSVLVFPEQVVAWPVTDPAALTIELLQPVLAAAGQVDLLLLGCGPSIRPVPAELRRALRAAGIVVEPMDTGGACRTYNVLMGEDRKVAAALIAV